jgi:hypothetical protein
MWYLLFLIPLSFVSFVVFCAYHYYKAKEEAHKEGYDVYN